MSGLTNATASAVIDDQNGVTTRTAPTTPLKLRVETVAGTTSAAGTELGSTTFPSITMGAASGTPPVASNSGSVTITCGAGGTVVAAAIWDSAGTPIRKWWGALTTSRTVVTSDSLVFAIGAVTTSITS